MPHVRKPAADNNYFDAHTAGRCSFIRGYVDDVQFSVNEDVALK